MSAAGGSAAKLAYAIHYRLHADFGHPEYAKQIDARIFRQSFEDEFSETVFAQPSDLKTIELGQFSVSLLGKEEDLTPLSLEDRKPNSLIDPDGQPDIFAALDWRSRLSQLYDRDEEKDRLWNWAIDRTTNDIKVMLVSGPGGVGKSRLVAEVMGQLRDEEKWSVGDPLRNLVGPNVVYDGSGRGVALVIDYPEENFEKIQRYPQG